MKRQKIVSADRIETVLLSKILIEKSWNARYPGWEQAYEKELDRDSEDESTSHVFGDLVESIAAKGQDEPVTVRINRDRSTARKFPYKLVTGFRRCKALEIIAARTQEQNPTVKALVRTLDDKEARCLNIRENTSRDNLSGPDLAWAVWELSHQHQMSDNQIAKEIGKNQNYISKLTTIMGNMPEKCTKHWRERGFELLNVVEIYAIAKLATKEEREKAYLEACKRSSIAESSKNSRGGDHRRIDAAAKRLITFAVQLGTLERMQLISAHNLDFETHIEALVRAKVVKFPGGTNVSTRKHFARIAAKAWKNTLDGLAPPTLDEPEGNE